MQKTFTRARVGTFDSVGPLKCLIQEIVLFSLLSLTPLFKVVYELSWDAPNGHFWLIQ